MGISRTSLHIVKELPQLKGSRITDLFRIVAGEPGSALLLSGGEHGSARFSFIGCDPFAVVKSKGDRIRIDLNGRKRRLTGNPFVHLESLFDRYRVEVPDDNIPLTAGGIGYFGYELKNFLERLPQTAKDDLLLPDLYFCLYRLILIHDRKSAAWHISIFHPPEDSQGDKERVSEYIDRLTSAPRLAASPPCRAGGQLASNFSRDSYLQAVQKVREYICDGHIYQANLSQRFSVPFSGDSYEAFLRLYRINPASFYAYLNGGDFAIISSSPERFLLQQGELVETRPIKGTRPRGKTPVLDERLRRELAESPKDDAELSMIVDLLRNDLSRVCQSGTVKVAEHKRLEAYANVFHLVSIVTGQLEPAKNRFDLVKACFPGGSITGCPKIRSLEIIDEIEPHARSVYTGSIGYLSFHNSMDLNIAIRTAIVKNSVLYFNVGGGIVFDSDPEAEYMETLYKGESIIKSLGLSLE